MGASPGDQANLSSQYRYTWSGGQLLVNSRTLRHALTMCVIFYCILTHILAAAMPILHAAADLYFIYRELVSVVSVRFVKAEKLD